MYIYDAQAGRFQQSLRHLSGMGTLVMALTADERTTARGLIAKHGLQFPVGRSADARAIATATGAFVNDNPMYLQARLRARPRRRVVVSVYSSGAIGRLYPKRDRPDPLPTRTRPCTPIVISGANPAARAADTGQARTCAPMDVRRRLPRTLTGVSEQRGGGSPPGQVPASPEEQGSR